MLATVALTLKDVSGNIFMTAILVAQVVLGITNATIVGGVYQLASWLPATYIQVPLTQLLSMLPCCHAHSHPDSICCHSADPKIADSRIGEKGQTD
jgi:hypothetical protein